MKLSLYAAPHRFARVASALVLTCLLAVVAVADGVDDYVQKQMANRHIPGVSVAVIKDGKPVLLKGYGQANVELGVAATENTVYQLASVSKQFTATAIMMLAEEGKLSLDDKLPKFFDKLPAAWNNVTVRQLLNHTSGIKSYTNLPDFEKTMRQDFSREAIIKMAADAPVEFAPGEKYNYNNTGFYLLGMIIEKASGKEYGAFLTERIFQPLGMTATRLNDLREVIKGRATGYAWEGGKLLNGDYVSPTQPFSAGALISTVVDMAKWDAALYTDKLLKRASLEQMWTPEKLNNGKPLSYGYGWGVDVYRTRKRISHGGGINGFSTFIARFVDDKLTVVVLTNSESSDAGILANGIAEFFIPVLAENAPKTIADNDPKLTAFLKEVITSMANGEGNPDWFTPEARAMLFPDRIKQGKERMGSHGPLNTFELQEDSTEGGVRRRAYKVVFGEFGLRCGFTLAADGKIAGVGMRPL